MTLIMRYMPWLYLAGLVIALALATFVFGGLVNAGSADLTLRAGTHVFAGFVAGTVVAISTILAALVLILSLIQIAVAGMQNDRVRCTEDETYILARMCTMLAFLAFIGISGIVLPQAAMDATLPILAEENLMLLAVVLFAGGGFALWGTALKTLEEARRA